MPWQKITLSVDDVTADKAAQLQDEFTAMFTAAGAPEGAVLLRTGTSGAGCTLFFSPGASGVAAALLERHGASSCDAPPAVDLTFLVGHEQDREEFDSDPPTIPFILVTGAYIRATRAVLSLTQKELADMAGISIDQLTRFEQNRQITQTTFDRLKAAIKLLPVRFPACEYCTLQWPNGYIAAALKAGEEPVEKELPFKKMDEL